MSDRIAVMNQGRFEQIGTPRELYERPAQPLRRRVHRRIAFSPGRGRGGDCPISATDALRLAEPPRHRRPPQLLVLRPEKLQVIDRRMAPGSTSSTGGQESSIRATARCSTCVLADGSRLRSAIPHQRARCCRRRARLSARPRGRRYDACARRARPDRWPAIADEDAGAIPGLACAATRPSTGRRNAPSNGCCGLAAAGAPPDRYRCAGPHSLAVLVVFPRRRRH